MMMMMITGMAVNQQSTYYYRVCCAAVGERHRATVPPLDLSVVSEKLSGQIVVLHTPEVLSSSAVKLSWDVRPNSQQFIEGFRIKYRLAAGTVPKPRVCLLFRDLLSLSCVYPICLECYNGR